ncbi:unnamed protein product [Ostreobium quekettii]|uniref:Uncharacterized protein n=1 Tax=Ostreobium quekettii TaxID=121088 RepID=A0A8S1IPH3_9CHLO|nr:unnamed protein product [Ostreobium quekettii]
MSIVCDALSWHCFLERNSDPKRAPSSGHVMFFHRITWELVPDWSLFDLPQNDQHFVGHFVSWQSNRGAGRLPQGGTGRVLALVMDASFGALLRTVPRAITAVAGTQAV